MNVVELDEKGKTSWDDYVKQTRHGLPQHLFGWRSILSGTYGYKTHYLMARENGTPVGIMPLFIVNSRLMGRTAMTMPGGLCADTPEIAHGLIEIAIKIAENAKLKSITLQDSRQAWPGTLLTTNEHEYHIVELSQSENDNWKRLHRETRRQIRSARKNGYKVIIDREGSRICDFHSVFSHFLHKAGVPIFGKKFLKQVVEVFQGRFSIALVYRKEILTGGYFQLIMGDTVYGIWGATLPEFKTESASYIAYWEILSDAVQHGYRFWDLGRSPSNSNVANFKSKWTGTSKPVFQQVANIKGHVTSQSMVNRVRSENKFRIFMKVWSRLPYPLVQMIGPIFRRHVPFG